MNIFYCLLTLSAGISCLIRNNVRFRAWRIRSVPICWGIILLVATGTFMAGYVAVREPLVIILLISGSIFIGTFLGEIYSEIIRQISTGGRYIARQVGKVIPFVLLVCGIVFLAKNNPELLTNLLALFLLLIIPLYFFRKAFRSGVKKGRK